MELLLFLFALMVYTNLSNVYPDLPVLRLDVHPFLAMMQSAEGGKTWLTLP